MKDRPQGEPVETEELSKLEELEAKADMIYEAVQKAKAEVLEKSVDRYQMEVREI